jgi:uncharacterized protein YacL
MLILFLRVVFVALAVIIGMTDGRRFYDMVYPAAPAWFGGIMGFAVAVTLIAAEQAFRSRFTRSLVAVLIGLAGGLALSWLVLSVLRLALQESKDWYSNLDVPIVLVLTYLVMVTVIRNADRLRVVVPFVEFRAERRGGGPLVLAVELLGDGRLLGLLKSGLFADRVVIHQRIVAHWEALTRCEEPPLAARARRAIESLAELRSVLGLIVEIDATEIPSASDLPELAIRLARLETGRVASSDRDTVHRCSAQGVPVVDLAALAAALSPIIRPGEQLDLMIVKPGEARGQGAGFLDDGSLVVVAGAAERIGQNVRCTVLRMHTTANGRMVFAELAE